MYGGYPIALLRLREREFHMEYNDMVVQAGRYLGEGNAEAFSGSVKEFMGRNIRRSGYFWRVQTPGNKVPEQEGNMKIIRKVEFKPAAMKRNCRESRRNFPILPLMWSWTSAREDSPLALAQRSGAVLHGAGQPGI